MSLLDPTLTRDDPAYRAYMDRVERELNIEPFFETPENLAYMAGIRPEHKGVDLPQTPEQPKVGMGDVQAAQPTPSTTTYDDVEAQRLRRPVPSRKPVDVPTDIPINLGVAPVPPPSQPANAPPAPTPPTEVLAPPTREPIAPPQVRLQRPPEGMDDAALLKALEHDRDNAQWMGLADLLHQQAGQIAGTEPLRPARGHQATANDVLLRRKLWEQEQGPQRDLDRFLLGEWAKAQARGEEFDFRAALEQFKAENAAREGQLNRDAALERAKIVKPMHGRPTVKADDDGNMIAVDPNTGESFPVTDQSGKPVRANDRGYETDLQRLGEDMKFIGPINLDLDRIRPYARRKDQPGVGPIEGRLPDWATGNEGLKFRQSAGRIMNAIIYMTTGKQINEQETERQLQARGLGKNAAAQAYQEGIPALEQELRQAVRTYKSKYEPRVVGEYRKRGGFAGLEGLETPQVKSDADYEALPPGTEFLDPEGQLRRKP